MKEGQRHESTDGAPRIYTVKPSLEEVLKVMELPAFTAATSYDQLAGFRQKRSIRSTKL